MADVPEQNGSQAGAAASSGGTPAAAPLDDVMIAMDVVDTLRHDEQIVEREIDEETRKGRLIDRLREIYRSQGIEVPDRILEEGVKALEEQRFTYTPPKESWATWLANLYVTRHEWGRLVAGMVLALALTWSAWYAWVERPRNLKIAEQRTELSETLPKSLRSEVARIEAAGADEKTRAKAAALAEQGLKAAAAGDRTGARSANAQLSKMRETLSQTYTIRIINRRGAVTGFSRVPKVNRAARNFYVVVEAVDANGKVLPQTILNEETGKTEQVTAWAVRVPSSVYDRIRADKRDDGLLQNATVAIKARGKLTPDWKIETSGGTLTRWSAR